MNPRMKNPALVLGVNPPIQAMMGPIFAAGVPKSTLDLLALRVGQINTCELCAGAALETGRGNEMTQQKMAQVSRWREVDAFSDAERTAIALAEAITELDARYDSVPDPLWSDVEKHFDEKQRAALVMFVAAVNMFTRINVSTRQMTADWR